MLLVDSYNGTASASLVADALSGVLPESPTPIEELAEQKRKAEIQQLIKENPYQTGNLTDVLKLERLDPKVAAKLREEIHYQKHEFRHLIKQKNIPSSTS